MKKTTIPQLSSLYQAVDIRQEIAPLIIGERTNPTGSKKFRELLLADDFDGCLQVAIEQERIGAHVLDISAAWAGRNEEQDLVRLVKLFSQTLRIPLMIDSTSPAAIEKALRVYPGRPVINSINLEDGGKNLHKVCALAKKFGACLVALTIDEDGMAMESDKKFAIAKRIFTIATEEYGLSAQDLFFDPLTFTVGSGDANLVDAAIQTLNAIKLIKDRLPDTHTVLGLSNISFGLRPPARKVLNAVFLHEAVAAGLDAVIINPSNCIALDTIDQTAREKALDLLYNRQGDGQSPLMEYIDFFENTELVEEEEEKSNLEIEKQLFDNVLQGNRKNLTDLLYMLLDKYEPLEIVDQILVPAMKKVGELFGAGEMLLPFVLQSAEIMRESVDFLEPLMDKSSKKNAAKILLATVQGDVHDIGKNLVNIILSNNGYEVIDIGIKVPAEQIVEEAKKHQVDAIGLSGLLVKSAVIMRDSMSIFRNAGLTQPIMLGGAALTRKFVALECATEYPYPVIYCKDAFSGLKAMMDKEQGELTTTTWNQRTVSTREEDEGPEQVAVSPAPHIPSPANFGVNKLEIQPEEFVDLIKTQILFRGRWGYTRGSKSKEEYQRLLDETVFPKFHQIRERILKEKLLEPRVHYGWYKCYREGDTLHVDPDGMNIHFTFPRQDRSPYRSLVDYFNDEQQGLDVIGFFVATIGSKINSVIQKLYEEGAYSEYLHLHGFSVEATEALAEVVHKVMRNQVGIQYSGKRYSFGYSACPDLDLQKPLLQLLKSEEIGVRLTDSMEMLPEQSVSAMVVHHPQATYFSI